MEMPDKDYKIMIIEDDEIICEDIHSLILSSGYSVIGTAHNGTQALDMLMNRRPDFVLTDINLGAGMSGIDIAKVIHEKYQIPFVFLTSYDDDDTLQSAQEYSPYGYIVKPFQDRTLLTTIKMALFNHKNISEKQTIDKESVEQKIGKKLTEQEMNVLKLLVEGASYKGIGEELFISVNTVKHHTKNLYQKLEIKSRAELYGRIFS